MGTNDCDDDVQATVTMMMIENDELLFLPLLDEGRERNIDNDDGTTRMRTKTQDRRMRQANGKSLSCQEK